MYLSCAVCCPVNRVAPYRLGHCMLHRSFSRPINVVWPATHFKLYRNLCDGATAPRDDVTDRLRAMLAAEDPASQVPPLPASLSWIPALLCEDRHAPRSELCVSTCQPVQHLTYLRLRAASHPRLLISGVARRGRCGLLRPRQQVRDPGAPAVLLGRCLPVRLAARHGHPAPAGRPPGAGAGRPAASPAHCRRPAGRALEDFLKADHIDALSSACTQPWLARPATAVGEAAAWMPGRRER